jgi:hypothetical protein
MKETTVISAFPAVGKSWLFNELSNKGISVLDSDSSKFSWLSEGVRNPDFPKNYISHIKENIGKVDYIFVSSHKEVRSEMNFNLISYILVYPHESLIKEYIERFTKRGNDEKFIEFICKNWFQFINDLKNEDCRQKIQLLQGQFLSDVAVW